METVSLFEMKRVYGWWPCASQEQGEEMQLTVRLDSQVTWSNRTYSFFTWSAYAMLLIVLVFAFE